MSKDSFVIKSKIYKQIILKDENKITLLLKKTNDIKLKKDIDDNDQEIILNNQFKIKEFYIKDAFQHLLINRLSEEFLAAKSDSSIEKIRKYLVLTLGLWEKEIGEGLNDISQRNYLNDFKNVANNKKIIDHFKYLAFLSDKLLKLIKPTVKWYWMAVDIKVKILISFCNAIDFKLMIKEYNPESSKYIYYREIYQILMEYSEECIDLLWYKHHAVEIDKRTTSELQTGINILNFFIHFEGLIKENNYENKYKKKKKSWENYRENLLKKKNQKN